MEKQRRQEKMKLEFEKQIKEKQEKVKKEKEQKKKLDEEDEKRVKREMEKQDLLYKMEKGTIPKDYSYVYQGVSP